MSNAFSLRILMFRGLYSGPTDCALQDWVRDGCNPYTGSGGGTGGTGVLKPTSVQMTVSWGRGFDEVIVVLLQGAS